MPVTTLNPTAEGSETNWTLGAGGSKTAAVLGPDDADATYISKAGLSSTSAQTFVTEDLPGAAVGVKTVTVRHRARRADTLTPVSACNGVLKFSTDILGPVVGGVYWNRRPETFYQDFLTPDIQKLDHTAWTVANINACQVGVRLASVHPPDDAGETVRVTTLGLDVAWDAAAAAITTSFANWVGGLIGAVIGSGLGLEHMPKIAAYIARDTHNKHRILANEYQDLLDSFRAPRRVYA